MPLYQYKCTQCSDYIEKLMKHNDPAPTCTHGHGDMTKQFTAPAFKFKNGHGQGTSMGNSMAIPGYPLPPV